MHLSLEPMPAPLRRAVRAIAERLRASGHRAWLVGGAVRDLLLGIEPHDADVCSAALPEEVEAAFERTHAVGRAFGTILVLVDDAEVQVTTFRSEEGYADARRPDRVRYGKSLEEDARRRDFTCNALYLDPLDGELTDPVGGLADLRARRLRCVGDPTARFSEDGLRLLRLARFAARFDLAVDETSLAAARDSIDALRGVSGERILAELTAIGRGPRPARAVGILARIGVLQRLFPGSGPDEAAVERLGPAPGAGPLLALILAPVADADRTAALERLEALHPSRDLRGEVGEIWSLGQALDGLLERDGGARRSERLRLVREPGWPRALRVWRARFPDARGRERELARLLAFAEGVDESERFPAPWIRGRDLEAHGVAPGPRFGAILREAEDLRLDGEHATRAAALAWLAERVAREPRRPA